MNKFEPDSTDDNNDNHDEHDEDDDDVVLQDGLSSGHASDLDEEESNPSALTLPVSGPPHLTKSEKSNKNAHLLSNLLAMETLGLPPPSPAPETPSHGQTGDVAAAIKDIKRALQSSRTLQSSTDLQAPSVTHNLTGGADPWLPRAGDQSPPPPLPPQPSSSPPPSPACSTPPPPPPVELEQESDSDLEEERVPTPEVMKKEEEDLDTDQVRESLSVNISLLINQPIPSLAVIPSLRLHSFLLFAGPVLIILTPHYCSHKIMSRRYYLDQLQ